MRTGIAIAALMGSLVLSGCGGEKPAGPPKNEQPEQAAVVPDASSVLKGFQAAGLQIERVKVLDERTDGNELLGRPHQYTSKLFFYDKRHSQAASEDGENTIEVFATADDAKARRDYIDGVTKGAAILAQYQELRGKVLVRLDKAMLPSEVKAYRDVLDKAVPES